MMMMMMMMLRRQSSEWYCARRRGGGRRLDDGHVPRSLYDSRHGSRERRSHSGHLHAAIALPPPAAAAAAARIAGGDAALRDRLDRLPQSEAVPAALSCSRRQYTACSASYRLHNDSSIFCLHCFNTEMPSAL